MPLRSTTGDFVEEVHDYDSELKPQEWKFRVNGKQYILREASAEAGRLWRNANMRGASMKDGRISMPETMADSETVLVQACTFEVFGDPEKERAVPIQTVRSWKDRIVRDLFERAKKMSGLDEVADPKKLPSPGTESSNSPESSESTSTS